MNGTRATTAVLLGALLAAGCLQAPKYSGDPPDLGISDDPGQQEIVGDIPVADVGVDVPAEDLLAAEVAQDSVEDVPGAEVGQDSAIEDVLKDVPVDMVVTEDIPADVALNCAPATVDDLILTEICADPGGKDPNNDCMVDNSDDEFVEFVNISDHAISLANVNIETKSVHTLPAQSIKCLQPHEAIVVWGSEVNLGLTNSGGTVNLLVSGAVSDTHTYGGEAGNDQSITREEQLNKASAWVLHNTVSDRDFSPGTCPSGNSFTDCTGMGSGCTPDCAGKNCGDNGCGGICGKCAPGDACKFDQTCVCIPGL